MLSVLRLAVQAVSIDGHSYDICVKLWRSNKVLLLGEDFEDFKAPGLLQQAVEAKAGCLEDEEEGIYWPPRDLLEKKGCYIFFPTQPRQGEVMIGTMLAYANLCTTSQGLRLLQWAVATVSHGVAFRESLNSLYSGRLGSAESLDPHCICPSAGISM